MTDPRARALALRRADGRCEDCGDPLVRGEYHAHHVTYERKGHERPEDLEILCLDCHGERHPWHEFVPVEEQRRRARERDQRRDKSVPKSRKVRCQECGRWVAPGKGFRQHVAAKHPDKRGELKQPPTLDELERERREKERDRVLNG